MTANQYLSQIREYELKIDRLNDVIESYKANFPGVMGTDYKAPRVASYPSDKIGAYVARVTDAQTALIEQKMMYVSLKNEAIQRINRITDGDCVDILMRKYVLYQTWGRIADETNYTKRHVFRLRNKALKIFEEVNNDLFCIS